MSAVYRLYDADGALLYVGCSENNRHGRLAAHRRKPWGARIATMKVRAYKSLDAMERAERAAILAERPIHNVRRLPVESASGMSLRAQVDVAQRDKLAGLLASTDEHKATGQ